MKTSSKRFVGSTRRFADETWRTVFHVGISDSVEADIRVPAGCVDRDAELERLRLVCALLDGAIAAYADTESD